MKFPLLLRPESSCCKVLKVNAPASHRCINVQEKRGIPDAHPSSLSYQPMRCLHSLELALQDRSLLQTKTSSAATEEGASWLIPLGMNCSRIVMWPSNCCQIFAGGAQTIRESIGKTLSWMVSINITRY